MQVAPWAFDFEEIFRAQYARITRVIARVVRDYARAEELAAEVFWKLMHNPRAHGDQCLAWLHRTAVRMSLNELRREARRARYERPGPVSSACLRRSGTTRRIRTRARQRPGGACPVTLRQHLPTTAPARNMQIFSLDIRPDSY